VLSTTCTSTKKKEETSQNTDAPLHNKTINPHTIVSDSTHKVMTTYENPTCELFKENILNTSSHSIGREGAATRKRARRVSVLDIEHPNFSEATNTPTIKTTEKVMVPLIPITSNSEELDSGLINIGDDKKSSGQSRSQRQSRARRVSTSSELPHVNIAHEPKRPWRIEDFNIGKKLGKGKFGNVYKAIDKDSGISVALKVLFKSEIVLGGERDIMQVKREVEIHSRLNHNNILRMLGHFHDDAHIYLILEFGNNGELYRHIKKMPDHRLPEKLAAYYVSKIGSAVQYLHERNVYHRDIKPENILLSSEWKVRIR
jgi:hypothetical protein